MSKFAIPRSKNTGVACINTRRRSRRTPTLKFWRFGNVDRALFSVKWQKKTCNKQFENSVHFKDKSECNTSMRFAFPLIMSCFLLMWWSHSGLLWAIKQNLWNWKWCQHRNPLVNLKFNYCFIGKDGLGWRSTQVGTMVKIQLVGPFRDLEWR